MPTPAPKRALVSELGVDRGVHWGTALIPDHGVFNLGQAGFSYSLASTQIGYLLVDYAAQDGLGPFFSGLTANTGRSGCYVDYRGPVLAQDLKDVSTTLPAHLAKSVRFASRKSDCHAGLLVFWAGGRYGVIDPIEIDVHQRLRVNWWLGEPGVVDFSVAGSDQQ